MSIVSPRALLISTAVVVLAVAGYAGYWVYAAAFLEDGFANWRAARQAEGYTVAHGAVSVHGFPTALRLVVVDPAFADPRRGWAWKGARVRYEMAPWNWRWYRLDVDGPHEAVVTIDGARRAYRGEAKSAVFVGRLLPNGRLDKGALDIAALRVRDGTGDPVVSVNQIRLRTVATRPAAGGKGSWSATVLIEQARFADDARLALGSDVARLEARGDLRGGAPARFDRPTLDRWRLGGGGVDLDWLKLVWGPLDLRAKGTVTVDERMRPLGAMTADIRGFNETIDALEQARLLRRKAAATSRMALSLLAKPDEDGNGSVLTVPVTAQDGRLYFGFVRLFALPPIPFPARSG